MQYRNLELSTQVLLVGLLLVLTASMLMRGGVVLWRKLAQVPHIYPRSWTAPQCRLMNRFCVVVGMVVGALWLALFTVVPKMPTNWPFGFLEATSLVVLLFLTNAWLILVLPRDWGALGALTERFVATLVMLATWWTLMIGGTAWMLAKASSTPTPILTFGPVVASVHIPIWPGVDAAS